MKINQDKLNKTNHYGGKTEKVKELFQRKLPDLVGFMGKLFPALMGTDNSHVIESIPKVGKHFNLLYKISLASIPKLTKIVQNYKQMSLMNIDGKLPNKI